MAIWSYQLHEMNYITLEPLICLKYVIKQINKQTKLMELFIPHCLTKARNSSICTDLHFHRN